LYFPSVSLADEQGLLAIGGDLSPDRLLLAYRSGIFPWYNEEDPICWWSPDPRCILRPDALHVSKSMRQVIQAGKFTFRINHAFEQVIRACQTVRRKEGNGTWIHEEMLDAYCRLHELGYAHSAECWLNDELVGGLYGVRIGRVFFGESMFSTVSNASKFAFINYVEKLSSEGVVLIDCQMQTDHLMSLGAEMMDRSLFIRLLKMECAG
jgi:leucyl/phenylalanyl-tRNA--protein transferase